MEESQQTVADAAELDPDLPDVLGSNEFLEVLWRDHVDPFDQTENPSNLLCMLVAQFVEKLFHWATAGCGSVEFDARMSQVNVFVNHCQARRRGQPNQALKLTQVAGCHLPSCGDLGSLVLFPTILLRSLAPRR